jgi:hypothetical protein
MRVAVLVLALVSLSGGADAAVPGQNSTVPAVWFGTWKVSVEKSTYTGEPGYKRATYVIRPALQGLTVIYEAVLPRGGVQHLEWTGALDGRDYPVQGVDEFLTYSYTPVGDSSYEITARIDGRIAARSTVTFSPDGRTMTSTTTSRTPDGRQVSTATVYDREP